MAESDDVIEISARLWQRNAPRHCTAEGVVELVQVDLDQPLGERDLVGCGVEDCRATVVDGGNLSVGQVAAAGSGVAIADSFGFDGYSSSGDATVEVPGATSGRLVAVGDRIVVRNNRSGAAIAVDLLSGEEVWRTTGWLAGAEDGVVYVCRGQDADGLTAVDAAGGADLWETELACQLLVVHGDWLTVIGHDPNVDGGHRLIVLSAESGEAVVNEAFFDGIDDRVTGFGGAIAVGPNTVVAGDQANLVVLGDDGSELARRVDGLGIPMGEADGVAVLGSHNRLVGFGVAQMAELWTIVVDAFTTVAVDDGSIWLLDRAAGTVSRLDPRTGEALWTTPIGLTSSFDVGAADDTAYVLTTQAVIAVDNRSGEVIWSNYRPYGGTN